uniref:Cyclopropane-fatty-acyl-phospholipid synthase n=1 Tax=Elaeophora elaphi TaxID=1147741 RepID=A0A0R3RS36_9BILA
LLFKIYPFFNLNSRHFNGIIRNAPESLLVILPDINCKLHFGDTDEQSDDTLPVTLLIHKPISFCFRILLDPKIGLGEAYMLENWDAQPRIQDLLALLIRHTKKQFQLSKLLIYLIIQLIRSTISFINVMQHYYHANSLYGSAKNIHEHYDLGNNMFSLFLDPSMTYSSIPSHKITHSDNELLEEAQMRKYDQMFHEMNLSSDDRILEIGCGWGACAVRAAKYFRCKWTGLTISTEQFKTAQQRITDNELQDKVNIKLLDYRLENDIYDKIVAIEMIEAVGHEYLPQFFGTLRDRLRPGGKAYLQAITCPEVNYERYRRSSDFIKKYIFPGGHMPSERAIREALPPELSITKTTHIGQHYAPTLDLWNCAWTEHEEEILKLGYSRKFHRKWQFYFALCSVLFQYSHIDTVQILIEKSL